MSTYGYLAHYGVKGQKWGVRNGPPYPIEDKVLRKGTILSSVSTKLDPEKIAARDKKWMYFYNQDDEWDKKVYEGAFATYLQDYRSAGRQVVARYQYEIVKDLKMPNKSERYNAFKTILNENNKETINDIKDYQKYAKESVRKGNTNPSYKKYAKINLNKLKTEADYELAYEMFNHCMENISQYKSAKKYADYMSKNYDAMVDDNNQGRYNRAHDPIIIFRVDQAIKRLDPTLSGIVDKNGAGSLQKAMEAYKKDTGTRFLHPDEIERNINDVQKELRKYGEKVKL